MEAGSRRSQSWKVACALLALVAAAGVLGGATPAGAHSGDVIDSLWASSPPTVDGTMTPGEWAGAMAVDLGAIPGNFLASSLLVMNDATYLWVAYDAVGDRTASVNDSASFAFDTGHDAVGTNGAEDQFIVSGIFAGGSAHLVYSGGGYIVEDSPFDPGLPDHAGLAGARGFGPSDLQSADHRIYEFQIPLVLVGANPGDTLGLFGGSQFVPGVLDYEAGFAYSTWPTYVTSPIPLPNYGDLVLAALSAPIGVSLSPSATSANGVPGETIWYNLTARNTGTSVNDTFDVAVTSAWTAALWNATGAVPLADTDGDTVPDTGNLTPGGRATFIVKVSIPPSATGCDVATITATSSWNLSISDSSTLNTCVGPAMFAPPHSDVGLDDNGNGKFDRLRVNVSVNVGQSGVYFIIGDFFNANHTLLIMSIGTGFAPPAGSFVVPLDFDGRTIFTSGQDGPYPVELTLYDSSFRAIDSDTYLTGPYNATDFEPPRALFRPPHTDVGVDTDVPPNGFYDQLLLNVSLFVGVAGTYSIDTTVYDSIGFPVAFSSNSFTLPTGNVHAVITYPGDRFYTAPADGPYTIDMYLRDSFGATLDFDIHITGPYARTDFDPPPIVFAPPHSDRGVDTDVPPDGLFDWLVVSANVNVTEAGAYSVRGDLLGPGGFPYIASASVSGFLGLGTHTLDLRFPGPAIRRAQVSGYFMVYLTAGPATGNVSIDFDIHTTGYYAFTDFQPPPAVLSPPHSDRAVDASVPADGLYDWLEVDVNVTVSRAGVFTLVGAMQGPRGYIDSTSATMALPVGPATIPLRFDGHAIRLSGFDASFLVSLSLRDGAGTEVDTGIHWTAPYRTSDFSLPDSIAPTSVAAVSGGYWKNGPVRLSFAATDPSPSDGLASVELHSRYSADNTSWSPWTVFDTKAVGAPGLATFAGSFLFDLPAGEGYYEFYTVATDRAGFVESAPAAADTSAAAFVPAQLDLTPTSGTLVAGTARTFRARVLNAAGVSVVLETPLVVPLIRGSAGGEFRAVGTTTAITSITIPAGASEGSFDYYDTVAGVATVTVTSSRTTPDSSIVTVSPAGVAAIALSPAAAGLAVGSSIVLTAVATDAYGNVVPGAPITWAVEGPATLSDTSGASVTLTVTGPGIMRVTATTGTHFVTSRITGFGPSGDGGASGNIAIGLGGGIALGIVVGVAVGWFLFRRRKGGEPVPPPPGDSK